MTYLTNSDWSDLLVAEQRIKTGILRTSDFEDLSDRTLTLGLGGPVDDPSKQTFEHIYLEGGQLRRHSYVSEHGQVYTQAQTASEGIHVLLLRPSIGAAPSATDLEFARLMGEFNQWLTFFEPESEDDLKLSENRVDGDFFGWRQKYYFENGNSELA